MRSVFRSHDMILLYHRVASRDSDPWSLCVTPAHFVEHLQVLRSCEPITLAQVTPAGRHGGKRPRVAVTFDDGYADNLYTAKPLLERYDVSATFFLATGYVGQNGEFWWDELQNIFFESSTLPETVEFSTASGMQRFRVDKVSRMPLYMSVCALLQPMAHEERREVLNQLRGWSHQPALARESHRVMTTDEVCKLGNGGSVEIGAHTVTHPRLSSQSMTVQQTEVRQSKAWLEDLLERPITSFSYPYGGSEHYSRETVELVEDAGYVRACTTAGRRVRKSDSLYELPRINITDMNGEEFEKLVLA